MDRYYDLGTDPLRVRYSADMQLRRYVPPDKHKLRAAHLSGKKRTTAEVLRNAKSLCDGLDRYTKSDPSHLGNVDERERFSKAVHERLRINAKMGRHENYNQIAAALAQRGIKAPGPDGEATPWVPDQYARKQPQNRTPERIAAKAKQLVAKGKYLPYDEIAKTL